MNISVHLSYNLMGVFNLYVCYIQGQKEGELPALAWLIPKFVYSWCYI